MSLKLVPFKSLGAVSYWPYIVTVAVSVAVCEMFSVKEMSDPKPRFHGHDICQRQMSPYGRRNG